MEEVFRYGYEGGEVSTSMAATRAVFTTNVPIGVPAAVSSGDWILSSRESEASCSVFWYAFRFSRSMVASVYVPPSARRPRSIKLPVVRAFAKAGERFMEVMRAVLKVLMERERPLRGLFDGLAGIG